MIIRNIKMLSIWPTSVVKSDTSLASFIVLFTISIILLHITRLGERMVPKN